MKCKILIRQADASETSLSKVENTANIWESSAVK